jgi:hypothetical protein
MADTLTPIRLSTLNTFALKDSAIMYAEQDNHSMKVNFNQLATYMVTKVDYDIDIDLVSIYTSARDS